MRFDRKQNKNPIFIILFFGIDLFTVCVHLLLCLICHLEHQSNIQRHLTKRNQRLHVRCSFINRQIK